MHSKTAASAVFLWTAFRFLEPVMAVAEELSPEVNSGFVGIFANRHDKANHVRAVSEILDVPDTMSLSTGNAFSIEHLEESQPILHTISQRFPNGQIRSMFSIHNQHEISRGVMFTATNNSLHGAINYKGKGYIDWSTDSFKGFEPNSCDEKSQLTMDFRFTADGVLARFNGQTERLYRPTLYPYMLGAFELDTQFAQLRLPMLTDAEALLQTANVSDLLSLNADYWIFQGPFHNENEFSLRILDSRWTYRSMELVLHTNKSVTVNGLLYFTMTTSQRTSKLRCEYVRPAVERAGQNFTIDFVYTSALAYNHFAIEITDYGRNDRFHVSHMRTVPWSYYGTYEDVHYWYSVLPKYYDWQNSGNETECTVKIDRDRQRGRLIRIYRDASSGHSIFQESSCWKGTFPINFGTNYRNTEQNITDERYSKIQAQSEIFRNEDVGITMKFFRGASMKPRGLTFRLSPDPKEPLHKLRVNYTNALFDHMPYPEKMANSSTQSDTFQRIFSPLVVGKFRSEQERSEAQIIQTEPNRFRLIITIGGQPLPEEIIRFNKPFWLIEHQSMVFWHYVESGGKVIASMYQQRRRNSEDAARERPDVTTYIFTVDGFSTYECRMGSCREVMKAQRMK